MLLQHSSCKAVIANHTQSLNKSIGLSQKVAVFVALLG
jgi:hypothetical protein